MVKRYKIYFAKSDTPYRQDFQPKKKFHTVWRNLPYKTFLGHKVVKIKKYGIFTIYKSEGADNGLE